MKGVVRLVVALLGLSVGCGAGAQNLSVATNVLDYVNMGTLNLSASYGVARHWSVEAGMKYNPFTWGEGDAVRQSRQRSLSAGARFWPWYVYSGWWVSGGARLQEYSLGGFSSSMTSEGDRAGAMLKAGYAHMIGPHFNVDLGAGIWGGYDRYVDFSCPTCGDVLSSGGRLFLLPADFILSLSYIF